MLLLGALVTVATASLGSVAYNSSRTSIEVGAVREVGITANARKQALIRVLTQESLRAAALLKTASLGCAPEETWCLRRVLADFVAMGGATAVRLFYGRHAPITVGKDAAGLPTVAGLARKQVARFDFDDKGQPYYVIVTSAVTEDGEIVVTLRGDMEVIDEIFRDRYGLGQSGETFLTDSKGRFLTAPRSDTTRPAVGFPSVGKAMQLCLGGSNGEILDQDYQGVGVIRGFRHVGEIGGGCVMGQIDQAEAFAPASALRKRVAGLFVLLAILAITCSFLFAQLVSRPINKLSAWARSLQAGDYDSPVPVTGPAEVRVFAQTFDAMARSLKDSRTALQKSTEQIGNILESMSEGFCTFDREWRCTYVNENATVLSQISREQLLGKKLWELLPGVVNPTLKSDLQRAMSGQAPVQFEEYYAPLDSWFEVNAFPIRDGIAVFGRDVTEQRRFKERLQQAQKLESLGVLAGGLAHDFNNLLTPIMGNASLAMQSLPSQDAIRPLLQDVILASEQASNLTRQLLAYTGRGKFLIEPVDLSELVRETTGLLRASISRNVALQVDVAAELPAVEADVAQMQQIVMNLVINAGEAIGEENGWVRVRTGIEDIDQSFAGATLAPGELRPGQYVFLEVRDNGCGMDETTKGRIFDPFFTTKFTGRGLGLSAVAGIVRSHGGMLNVDSAPGQGTTLKLWLPATSARKSKRQREVRRELMGRGTVLFIDDEDTVRRLAKAALEHYGYTVMLAADGYQAVEIFSRTAEQVLLVILDMTMPGIGGQETFRRLKAIRPEVPVLLSSGFSELEASRRFQGQGVAGFLQKPYSVVQLVEKVQSASS